MRKRRNDSFFGLHSDFHAKPQDGLVIGATLREEDICKICETLHPDFIQIDCKGHPGWASYPSGQGNAMPQIQGDPLAMWRKVTKEYDVALYMHFSGVYEVKYCAEHPQECALGPKGEKHTSVRMDSRYFEEDFIAQIGELYEKYGVDGVWIDGDCWSVVPDYSIENIKRFDNETGICFNGNPPEKPEDQYYKEFLDYTRNQFRQTLKKYVDILHSKYPGLQVCSNWAFSDHMPEAVCADVDFLSGDLNPKNCFNSARYAGRMLAQQGMSWDLMSWGFRYRVYDTSLIPPKHITQILQEAAAVIALGGAYQDNVAQFPDGSPDVSQMEKLKPLAEFMRAREPYCFKGKMLHQAAILVSTHDRYSEMTKPFSREGMEKYMGLVALCCDAGICVETVCEHTLENHYADYPLLIVPELYDTLPEKTIQELKAYVENGGSLLLAGSSTVQLFAKHGFGFFAQPYVCPPQLPGWANCNVGHDVDVCAENVACYFTVGDSGLGVSDGACEISASAPDYTVHGRLQNSLRDTEGVPFAVSYPFGKGKVCAIGMNLGTQYYKGMQYQHRKLIADAANALFTPVVQVAYAGGLLEIVCLEKDGKLLVQLVNANGAHANDRMITEDYISPVLDIALNLRLDKEPKALVLQPEGTNLSYTYKDGCVTVSVPRVNVHSIIEVVL